MKTLFVNSVMLVFLFIITMAAIGYTDASQTSRKVPYYTNNPGYGWVYASQLSDFSPAQYRDSYALLSEGRLAEAALGLQQELAKHPNSLAAYVGLMQAEPDRWQREIDRLQAKIAQQREHHQEAAATDLFKLGTLLFYQRERGPTISGQPRFDKQEIEARALLAQAWSSSHAPVIGLMFIDMLVTAGFTSNSTSKPPTAIGVGQQMLEELAGPEAFSQYLNAQKSVWNTEPPSVSLVPKKNLLPLIAVMASVLSIYEQRSGTLKVIDGKPKMTDFPVPNSQIAHERYLEKWYDNLVAALKS